jgi:hypothetical protein
MIFTTNKPLNEWGKVLHDEDMAAAILDRVLERGRFIHLDGPSGRTRHLNLEETLPANTKRLRISGIGGSEFPEPTSLAAIDGPECCFVTAVDQLESSKKRFLTATRAFHRFAVRKFRLRHNLKRITSR